MSNVEYQTKYLEFRVLRELPKTKVYEVRSVSQGRRLGLVKWFGRWRQYCFYPDSDTIWNKDCLADIIDFIGEAKRIKTLDNA